MEEQEEYRRKISYHDEATREHLVMGLCLGLPIWGKMYHGGEHAKGRAGRED